MDRTWTVQIAASGKVILTLVADNWQQSRVVPSIEYGNRVGRKWADSE